MINQFLWVQLPQEVRVRVAAKLAIPRSEPVHIHGGKVLSDGHSSQDLASVTIDKLKEATKSKLDNFDKLFDLIVRQVEAEIAKEKPKTSAPKEDEDVEINRDDEGNLTIKLQRTKR